VSEGEADSQSQAGRLSLQGVLVRVEEEEKALPPEEGEVASEFGGSSAASAEGHRELGQRSYPEIAELDGVAMVLKADGA